MLIFAIAFRGKGSTDNWEACVDKLNKTLSSIRASTDNNYKVLLAYTDMPKITVEFNEENLELIHVPTPTPSSWLEMARDKFWKYYECALRIQEILQSSKHPENGIYVLPMDADDLINRHTVEYVNKNPNCYGLVSSYGYVMYDGFKTLRKHKDLHTYCGSCNIIKMYSEDLPNEKLPISLAFDKETAVVLNDKYPIRWNHHEIVDRYKKIGKPFSLIPFATTVYCRDYNANISKIAPSNKPADDGKRFHPIAFIRKFDLSKYVPISKKIKQDFSL